MLIDNRLYLKTDNSVFGDLSQKKILISDRQFKPSNISGNENIQEAYKSIDDIITQYESIDKFFFNVFSRDTKYTILSSSKNYAYLFSYFIKSFYDEYDINNVYRWYCLNIYNENSISNSLNYTFRLKGLDGVYELSPYDLYLNKPISKDEFTFIFNTTYRLNTLSNIPNITLPIECLLLEYLNTGRYLANLDTINTNLISSTLIHSICKLKKDIMLNVLPKYYLFENSNNLDVDPLNKEYHVNAIKVSLDNNFSIRNMKYILDNYTINDLIYIYKEMNLLLGLDLDRNYVNLFNNINNSTIDLILNYPRSIYGDSQFVYNVNRYLIEYIVNDINNDKSFIKSFSLKSD